MKLKTVLCDQTRGTGCLRKHPLLHLTAASLLAAQLIPNVAWAQVEPAPPLSGVLGKIQSISNTSLDVATPSGVVHVVIKQPLATYKQMPSDLSHVTSSSYVGVPSVQQADGTELAKQVIIFPKELRGAAEGSVLLDAPDATSHNRMTNGSVSRPAVSRSRMTNGTVQKDASNTLVVRYQDGSQTISISAGVQIVLVAKETVTFSAGDT